MTKTEPRSAGSGGGRDKTQPTPTDLLAQRLRDHAQVHDDLRHMDDEQKQWSDDLREAAELLTTLSAREDGWQLIDSALPDDDDHVLVCWHDGSMAIAYYVSERGWFDTDCSDEYDYAPAYWRKLPESPKAPTAGEDYA